MADRDPQTRRRSGTEAVDQLRRDYPTALIDEVTGARTGTVLVSDLARSRDEFLVDPRGKVIDPAFVVPDQVGSIDAGVPEVELIRGRRDAEDPGSGRT